MSDSSQDSKKTGIDRRRLFRSATALAAAAACPGLLPPTLAKAEGPNTDGGKAHLFPDTFKAFQFQTSGAKINGVIGGKGPPAWLGVMAWVIVWLSSAFLLAL